VPRLLKWKDPGAAFTAVIQLGTMLAVLILLLARHRPHRLDVVPQPVRQGAPAPLDARMAGTSALGTIPVSAVGLVFNHAIEGPARNLWINAGSLIVMGLVLLVAEWAARQKREIGDLTCATADHRWLSSASP